MSFWF